MLTQEIVELLARNNFAAAQAQCTEILRHDPANAEVWHLQGLVKSRLGQFDAAIASFYEALRLAPNNAEIHNNLASLFYSQGRIAEAIPIFEKAIRLDPLSWEAHYNLANCYIKKEMVNLAISHYQTVLELQPQHGNAKQNLTMSLVSIKDYATALPYLIEVAAANPQHAELQGHLAECYLELGKSAEALQQYVKALALEPNRAEWQHNLAVLYLRNKQQDLAREHFAKTLALHPNNPTAQHMLHALQQGNVEQTAPTQYVSDLFDQYANYYNKHVREQLHYQVPQLLRQTMGNVLGIASNQLSILDLGCGTGLCGVYFRDLARLLIGVDISAAMLTQAKTLGAYDGLCRCDILQVIPGAGLHSFDLILAADVFVYIGDLTSVFQLLSSALKYRGKIAFTVEALDGEGYKLLSSGRFAHSAAYTRSLAEQFNFQVLSQDKIVLREQAGEAINGLLYVLQCL